MDPNSVVEAKLPKRRSVATYMASFGSSCGLAPPMLDIDRSVRADLDLNVERGLIMESVTLTSANYIGLNGSIL